MIIIKAQEVQDILADRERAVLRVVDEAYRQHEEGAAALPHSTFLRFPDDGSKRIIGLPAYLGGSEQVSGFKWISSFPENVAAGIPRANAVIVLNEMVHGRPNALIEGSLISAHRTAASAVLAACALVTDQPTSIGLVGAGPINRTVLRFARTALPSIVRATVHDRDAGRARRFADDATAAGLVVEPAEQLKAAVTQQDVVSFATSAPTPYTNLSGIASGATVLNVSLRDLDLDAMRSAQHVVDDLDHVNRENTSVHRYSRHLGHTDFVDATIGALLRGTTAWVRDPGRPVVFSPFGLGVLDLALARYVVATAIDRGVGRHIEDFFEISQKV